MHTCTVTVSIITIEITANILKHVTNSGTAILYTTDYSTLPAIRNV